MFELLTIVLCSIFVAGAVTTLCLVLLWTKRTLRDQHDLVVHMAQLLVAKDPMTYDALRRVVATEDDTEGPAYYYTGDAMQYQDDQLKGLVSDDELTGISNFSR